ncbi:hypothetical protein [Mycolicibacterium helvum]|uniref:Uncharacterized protein n=1 Tax=Mycolicibacterium helvum TaxID=1534349 RepID=A0A7I7T8S0_9MYCO|nr:hypothetical protein [Mycolicibacterium helvum]BBY65468.1 hypothetical protein MHEL_37110 [Mycolicibacterium helvum]
MDLIARTDFTHNPIRRNSWLFAGAVAVSSALALSGSPIAAATSGESGAVTGAGFGPTLGVGDASSYTGGSTSTHLCHQNCTVATLGVGGPSSYTGGATVNHPGGTATHGVGDVNSYTGQGTSGAPRNGTNATTRTGNYGPGHAPSD